MSIYYVDDQEEEAFWQNPWLLIYIQRFTIRPNVYLIFESEHIGCLSTYPSIRQLGTLVYLSIKIHQVRAHDFILRGKTILSLYKTP